MNVNTFNTPHSLLYGMLAMVEMLASAGLFVYPYVLFLLHYLLSFPPIALSANSNSCDNDLLS